MAHSIGFAPEAEADLIELYDYIAAHSDPERALAYVERITETCRGLATFPARGTPRDDIRAGLRVTSIARRVVIAYHVASGTVTIDRVLYGGRDLATAFADE